MSRLFEMSLEYKPLDAVNGRFREVTVRQDTCPPSSVVTMVTTGMKLQLSSCFGSVLVTAKIKLFIAHEFVVFNHKTHKS